ncbi:unnamed protein product [Camellia sinensis]
MLFYLSRFLHTFRGRHLSFFRLFNHSILIFMSFLWLEFSQSFQVLAILIATSVCSLVYGYRFWIAIGLPGACFPFVVTCQIVLLGCNVLCHAGVLLLHFWKGEFNGIGAWGFNSVLNAAILSLFLNFYVKMHLRRRKVADFDAIKDGDVDTDMGNNAMSLWTKIKGKGSELTGPQPIRKSIQKMLINGVETWLPKLTVKRAVVDFSSPNIAKEMHVGHLRSTIIRDTLARMLEFSNVEVLWRNHVGDWGTQFGMLIEFLFKKFPNVEVVNDQAIGDLEAFYKASKQRLDGDPGFKERAQQAVVSFQGGEEKYRKAWAQICEISRRGYPRVYQRLGIKIEEKGESFYNPYIPGVLEELDKQGLIEESEGACVIFIEGKNIPLIVVKKDGGFNYASTDLAAFCERWAAKRVGWLPASENMYPKTNHVGFGLVLGEDGKRFQTRSTEVVRLIDLLDEAKSRCKAALVERGKADKWTEEELDQTAEAVGYGAVK